MSADAWTPFEHSVVSHKQADNDDDLLSATYRTGRFNDQIVVAKPDLEYLEADLLVNKLNELHCSLWYAGLPRPPRPLHHQEVIHRKLVLTEQMSLHLIWTRKHELYLKPIPRYLLSKEFWLEHLASPVDTAASSLGPYDPGAATPQRHTQVIECALGFLFSYTALIAYESDFRIAHAKGLLPDEVTWPAWKAFSRDILNRHDYAVINARFRYGELRLSRLNEICRWKHGQLGGYTSVDKYRLYIDFFQDNLGNIAAVLGYIVVVLEALQVGLASRVDQSFSNFAWGFAIFAIVTPVFLLCAVILAFIIAYSSNWRTTKAYHEKRVEFFQSAKLNGEKHSRAIGPTAST